MDKFDTHKFLFTLFYEKKVGELEIEFYDKNSNLVRVKVLELFVTNSPISCRVKTEDSILRIPYVRIFRVFQSGELIWENSEVDSSEFKVISGYK